MIKKLITIAIAFAFLGNFAIAIEKNNEPPAIMYTQTPEGYIHRPVIEDFMGLSCPPCMNVMPEIERYWNEEGYKPEVPFTYVVFHQLNGGGVDDLQTEESEERMRYYQPGISGTPDIEVDGGWVELGGVSGRVDVSYDNLKSAVEDAKTRYETTLPIDPFNPVQSATSGFKYVNLYVNQIFTGNGFGVTVEVEYLGANTLVETNLNGALYVFMVEDNVTAYSKVLDEDVNNHNVFRGYAIKDEQFTLAKNENDTFSGFWEIPKDVKVPIKEKDITAVAVVYDTDDTQSERNNDGNANNVPRAIQSATPLSTAYDRKVSLPKLKEVKERYENGKTNITVQIEHEHGGIVSAYIFYNFNATNETNWRNAEMSIFGGEACEDDSKTCVGTKNPLASVEIEMSEGTTIYYVILMYSGNGTQGKTEVLKYTAKLSASSVKKGSDVPLTTIAIAVGVVGGLVLVGMVALRRRKV